MSRYQARCSICGDWVDDPQVHQKLAHPKKKVKLWFLVVELTDVMLGPFDTQDIARQVGDKLIAPMSRPYKIVPVEVKK